jgi:hypothetical protein
LRANLQNKNGELNEMRKQSNKSTQCR